VVDIQSPAAKSFYKAIRDFALRTRTYEPAIRYFTKPDERRDLSLVSQRVYGRRDEFVAVMAAAGLDSLEEPLPERLLTLPDEATLRDIKRRTGFESRAAYREEFKPVWAE
jgi:hypothetical protein